MTIVKLTDAFVRGLKPPERERTEITDELRPGLRLRISPKGRITWMYEKRVKGGKKRKHDLGVYPHTSIKEARRQALEIQVEADAGIDRILIKEQQKEQEAEERKKALPLRKVLEIYYDLHCKNLRTGAERMEALRTSLSAHLDEPAQKMTQQELQGAIDAKARSGALVQANRIKAYLTHFSKFSRRRGHFADGVGVELEKAVREIPREREPSLEEVRAIYNASFGLDDLWGPLVRLLILTVQREDEIAGLYWSEVDFEGSFIIFPGARTKNGKPHITHLSDPARLELEWLRAWADEDAELVFSTTGNTPVSGFGKMKKRLDKLLAGRVEPWRIHDLRTGFATAMAEAGDPEGVVDRVLNHDATGSAPSAVARVYNRARMLSQRKTVLDRWAEMVTAPAASNVVKIA